MFLLSIIGEISTIQKLIIMVSSMHMGYLLFMNNDIEMIAPDSINEMVGYAQRADVGAVGCRLLYPDNTIQHAGVIVGIEGVAGHAFRGCTSENTYQKA